jgi:hypothetical protein
MRDPLAPHAQQVFGCQLSRRVVVAAHKVRGQVFELAVQQDQGRVTLLYLAERLGARLAGGDNQCIQAVRQQMLNLLPLQLRFLLRRGNDQEVPLLAKRKRKGFRYVREKRVDEVGNDDPDQVRSSVTRLRAVRFGR